MSEVFPDGNDNPRVVIRNIGPAGPGVPEGGSTGQILVKSSSEDYDTEWSNTGAGTGDVIGPASSVNNRLSAFNGTTGKVIKDSGLGIADVFTVAAAANKVDKVTGKGLSTNDFTDTYRTKLDGASLGNYRGTFSTLIALTTAIPAGNAGDYANVVTFGTDMVQYTWDDVNALWVSLNAAEDFNGDDIATLLYNTSDAAGYDKETNRIFTTADKTALDGAASEEYVNSLAQAAGIIGPAYAAFAYFDATGTAITITGVSDGTTNLVKVGPTTVLDPASISFTSAVPGRLVYTGVETRLLVTTFNISMLGTANANYVVLLSKNGSLIPVSRTIVGYGATPLTTPASNTVLLSLSTNDYIEVFIGNMTDTNDPTVKVLSLEISPA